MDNERIATEERVATAAKLGFTRWISRYDYPKLKDLAGWCLTYGIGLVLDMAYWGDDFKQKHPEMAFRNHEGLSSFASHDRIVPANTWPSFWHPKAVVEIMEPAFKRVVRVVGDSLVGFAIGIGEWDATVMPINWRGYPDATHHAQENWVFDVYALDAYANMYGPAAQPAAHPSEDENLETLRFIQAGMLTRLNEIALLGAKYNAEIWPMVLPFPSNSYHNMAAGYAYGLHGKLAGWAHQFKHEHGIHVGFLIPHLFGEGDGGLPDQVACAAFLADSDGCDCEVLVGAEVGPLAGRHWEGNLVRDMARVPKLGLHGLLCDSTHVTEPKNISAVSEILKDEID